MKLDSKNFFGNPPFWGSAGSAGNNFSYNNLLDNDLTTVYLGNSALGEIGYDFSKKMKVSRIEITSPSHERYDWRGAPKDIIIYASNDNISYDYILSFSTSSQFQSGGITENINLNCSKKYRYYKLRVISVWNTFNYFNFAEIKFSILAFKYLLKENNQYYTIKNNKLILLENQTLNKNNFETNGFDDLELMNNINKIDMKLLIYDESNLDKLKLKYTLKEPFRPIDKFKDRIKILKQEIK